MTMMSESIKKRYYNKGKDVYIGSIDTKGKRHGTGTYVFSDGAKYEGEWQLDRMHGKGVYTWPDGAVYKGEFSNGVLSGYGKKLFVNGDVYEGSWEMNVPNGFGKRLYKCGDKYEGNWENAYREGYGVYAWAESEKIIEGIWKNDKLNGRAILHASGKKLYTEFCNGYENGRSIKRAATQIEYSEWVYGNPVYRKVT